MKRDYKIETIRDHHAKTTRASDCIIEPIRNFYTALKKLIYLFVFLYSYIMNQASGS